MIKKIFHQSPPKFTRLIDMSKLRIYQKEFQYFNELRNLYGENRKISCFNDIRFPRKFPEKLFEYVRGW